MSSIVISLIILLVIAGICLALVIILSKAGERRKNSLSHRLKKNAHENNMVLSLIEEFKNFIFGLDSESNKLIVCKADDEHIIDLEGLKGCRKQKKWLHIPAGKGTRPETHLEKISLVFEFNGERSLQELVFYEYRHNSIFQMHEIEQKADYWELLFNQQIKIR
ncbi:MAG: hypothetical protein ABIR15_17800 [Chitinophagaceae bacterium]